MIMDISYENESDDEKLPEFIDHIPSINAADLNSLEDVDRFLDTLDTDPYVPRTISDNHSCLSAEEICAKFNELCKNSAKSLEKLKQQDAELKKTATKCKKTIKSSLKVRREATEAIKKLNANTQRVLDEDVDDATLESVQNTLLMSTQDKDCQNSLHLKAGATVKQSGIELQKSGDELKVILHGAQQSDEDCYVVLTAVGEQTHKLLESSHSIPEIESWIEELNSSSDWPKFYMRLRNFFTD